MDARRALLAADYDLVLLDLKLKDQCGFALMDHLVDRNLDTRVIVVTGQPSEANAITALKKGATDYLKKPFEPDDLLASVNRVLDQQRHQRELHLFKNMVAHSSAAIIVGDPDGRIVFGNGGFRKLMLADQPVPDPCSSDTTRDGFDGAIDEQIRLALKSGMPWEGRIELVNAAGQPFVAWKRVDPMPETIGGLTCAVALMIDMTAQLEKERTVASSRERYRGVIDSQKEYLFRLNTDFLVSFMNRAYAACWSKTPRDMIGQPLMTLVAESVQPLLSNTLEAVRSGSTPIEIEFTIAEVDDCPRWQRWRFEGIRNADGNVAEIQAVGSDVTQKKRVERETEENKEKFRNLAETTSDWIWEVDNDGVYTYASPVVHELLGYRPEEVFGKKATDFMPENEARRFREAFQRALVAGEAIVTIENINLRKDGLPVTLETSGVPIFGESGAIIGYRGVARDISIRKRAEKRLQEESDKLKQALTRVKRLSGMLPICASCKKIRDDSGYWNQIEEYIENNSDAEFSHGICPQCARKLYPELYE